MLIMLEGRKGADETQGRSGCDMNGRDKPGSRVKVASAAARTGWYGMVVVYRMGWDGMGWDRIGQGRMGVRDT